MAETKQYNYNCKLVRFALPQDQSLQLPVCACVLLKAPGLDGAEDVVRPYTPVSDDLTKGSFDLLVKVYEEGNASQYIGNLSVGDEVEFKHIPFNVKEQYPFDTKSVVMLAAGTGITPMYQALQCVFRPGNQDTTKVTLLYGNHAEKDILMREELEAMQSANPDRFDLKLTLSSPTDDWNGLRGNIDMNMIQSECPAPSAGGARSEQMAFVCGPPGMYDSLCGPRGESQLSGALADIGYAQDAVVKF